MDLLSKANRPTPKKGTGGQRDFSAASLVQSTIHDPGPLSPANGDAAIGDAIGDVAKNDKLLNSDRRQTQLATLGNVPDSIRAILRTSFLP